MKKKVFMMIAVIAMTIGFAACTNTASTTESNTATSTNSNTTTATTDSVASVESIAK